MDNAKRLFEQAELYVKKSEQNRSRGLRAGQPTNQTHDCLSFIASRVLLVSPILGVVTIGGLLAWTGRKRALRIRTLAARRYEGGSA